MTNKSKIYSIIILTTIIVMVTVPNFLLDSIILDTEGGDDDESFESLMTPLTPLIDDTFPNNSLTFISEIEEIEGTNSSGVYQRNLDALKYEDGDTYDIDAESGVGGHFINIEFNYTVDLIEYDLEHYDIFLYVKTDFSNNGEIAYLQGFNSTDWYNITELTFLPIKINKLFLEKTIGFRIWAYEILAKSISIDQLAVLIAHSGKRVVGGHAYNSDYTITAQGGVAYIGLMENDNDWFSNPSQSRNLKQWSHYETPFYELRATTYIEVEMEIDSGGQVNIDDVIDADLRLDGNGRYGFGESWLENQYYHLKAWIWNYSADNGQGEWTEYRYSGGNTHFSFNWDVDGNFIDEENRVWKFRVETEVYATNSKILETWVWTTPDFYYSYADVEYLQSDYPVIDDISTFPSSPISTLTNFEILSDISSPLGITTAQYYIEGWSEEWEDLSYDTIEFIWKSEPLSVANFDNGIYTVWINATGTTDQSTIKPYSFEISNALPEITFITPNVNLEKIDQLYDYNVNVSITDVENDPYEPPDIMINELFGETILDWTPMEQFDLLQPQFWNYSIDPLDFPNGLYTVWVRTNDSTQISISNNIVINIINNPPSIEILEPSLLELITPMNQTIICNVTNEEVINSVQWDIVSTLDNFNWKDLPYTPATDLYNDTFSLLDYEYGDYYLVINATDDKFNSSIETKSLQFHPIIVYNYNYTEISYNSDGIELYSNSQLTTAIVGSVIINHNTIVKEREFELYIPEKYDEANSYYINRGFDRYEPEGIFVDGTYTMWSIPQYQATDTVYFSLEKPKIINALIEEDDDDVLTMRFTISSKHALTNIHVENQLAKYLSDPEGYDYTLYYMYEGDWVELDDYEVEAKDFPEFTFTWNSIGEGMTISFRFKAEPLEEEETSFGSSILWGSVFLAVGVIITLLYGFGTSPRKYKEMGVPKYVLLSAVIIGGLFGVGFVIGLFV